MTLRNDTLETPSDEPRFRLYRLCPCDACNGTGKIDTTVDYTGNVRCDACRGEGKQRQVVAECETPADIGLAIFTLGQEGEWQECPFGLLDTQGEVGKKWLISPWLPSARNVSDAGRVLAQSKRKP